MAKEQELQSIRDFGKSRKRLRIIRTGVIGILLVAIIAVGLYYLSQKYSRTYKSYEVINTLSDMGTSSASYIKYGSAIVRYNRDGATAVHQDGDLLWNGSYEMKEPIAAACGKYIAIADKGNKQVIIYNDKGEVNQINTLYNIIKVEVAVQGVIAVLMEDSLSNYISMYSEDGENLVNIQTDVREDGFPMDMTLSSDGEKLVTSYMKITTGVIVSSLSFYNFGVVGQSYTSRLVGAYKFEDEIIPKVSFMDNDTVSAFTEHGYRLYSFSEKPKLKQEETLEQDILSVMSNEKFTGLVLRTDKEEKRILVYDLDGKKVMDRLISFSYDKIFITGDELILHNDLSCMIIKTNGKEKFRATFDSNIFAFYPINHLDRYYLAGATGVSEIMLVE